MSRRVLMRAKMEDTLRANFQAAAARNFLPAATVLRQLMQAYVVVQGAPADPWQGGLVTPCRLLPRRWRG